MKSNLVTPLLLVILLTVVIVSLWLSYLTGSIAASNDGLGIGQRFHRETRLTWASEVEKVFLRLLDKKVPPYKTYENAQRIKLPKQQHQGITVESAIASRRSKRSYSSQPLSLAQLSQLLFAASGVTDDNLRAAPSAGATYPIELYVIINNAEGINQGIYHYNVQMHALEIIKSGDFRKQAISAGQEQSMLGDAAAVFVLSAIFDRVCWKYGDRGYRYSYIEAGHISQNIYLQAQSLGLGSVGLGGFIDHQVNALLGLDGDVEAAIYLHAVGAL